MKNFDIKERVQLYSYPDLKKLGKLDRFDKTEGLIKGLEFMSSEYDSYSEGKFVIALIKGDVEIETNLNINHFFDDITRVFYNEISYKIQLIWITGNLKVGNTLYYDEDEHYLDALVIEGSTTVKNIIQGDGNLYFLEELKVNELFYTKEHGGGRSYIGGKQDIKFEVENNYRCKINKKYYDLFYGVTKDLDVDEVKELIDSIFIKKFDFLVIDDEGGYWLDEDLLIEALLSDKQLFKEKIEFPKKELEDLNDIKVWIKIRNLLFGG